MNKLAFNSNDMRAVAINIKNGITQGELDFEVERECDEKGAEGEKKKGNEEEKRKHRNKRKRRNRRKRLKK